MTPFDLDFDEQFCDAFRHVSGPVEECHCGRTHVAVDSDVLLDFDDEPMRDSYIELAEEDDTYILHYDVDDISVLEVNHEAYVEVCVCAGYRKYMNFIIDERRNITRFLVSMAKEIEIAANNEKLLNILKDENIQNAINH